MSDDNETKKDAEKSEPEEKAAEKSAEKSEAKVEAKADKPKKAKKEKDPSDQFRIPANNPWAGMWKVCAGIGAVGVVGAAAGYSSDPRRFAFAWLFGFIVALTIAIGAMMFILIHHITSAGWGILVRRIAEFFASATPVFVVLAVPLVLMMNVLYGEWLGTSEPQKKPEHAMVTPTETDARLASNDLQPGNPHMQPGGPGMGGPGMGGPGMGGPGGRPPRVRVDANGQGGRPGGLGGPGGGKPPTISIRPHDDGGERAEKVERAEIMQQKKWYLNKNFFTGRLAAYLLIWVWLGPALFRMSTDQDKSKALAATVRMNKLAAPGLILMSFSLTFAAFDWIMSLDPTWYSTIFGVTFFAGSMVAIFAVIILTLLSMRQSGLLVKEVTVEHYHDLGKLLFGFMCFWAYVCFSQFMLIWYAGLPEEVTFYHARWDVSFWKNVSLALVILHFCIPFVFIMSRNVKRNLGLLRVGAITLLAMHVVDIYWLVMPNFHRGADFSPSWIDVCCLIGPVGIYLAVAFRSATQFPLVPVGDPRLARSLKFLNA